MIFDQEKIEDLTELLKKRDTSALEGFIIPVKNRASYNGLRRSALMVSANRVKHLNKLDRLMADIAMINLEDGVADEEKESARHMAAVFLSQIQPSDTQIVVRVNPLDEGGLDDIRLINMVRPHAIRIPKVTSVKEVEEALDLITPGIDLHLSVETKEAFEQMGRLKIDKRVTTFYLGILDLLVSLGLPLCIIQRENPTIQYILSRFLVESKMAGAYPVSFVYQDYKNTAEFEEWCALKRSMGFKATGCISPGQVEVANRIFAPDTEEIKQAQEIVQLFEQSRAEGTAGLAHERYGFIDEPIYKNALQVLMHIQT